MCAYIVRRLLLIVPTLVGIMVINFAIVQIAPGGPVEQLIAQITGTAIEATARIGGTAGGEAGGQRQQAPTGRAGQSASKYRGARGLDPEFIKELERLYGFDKPAHERFLIMMGNYVRFDFGNSYFRDRAVVDLVLEKMPVSISLGLWTTLLVYLISVPLGIRKAIRDGSRFDVWTSAVIIAPTPRLWLNGLSVETMVCRSMRQSRHRARAVTSRVLSECMTPLGRPVEPEVTAM